MIEVYDEFDLAEIDHVQPVNWLDPLSDGLKLWTLTLPGLSGGNLWHNLVDPSNGPHGTLGGNPPWGGAMGRQGGLGSLAFTNSLTIVSHPRPTLTGCSAFTFCAWFLLPAVQLGVNAFGKWDMGTGVVQHLGRWVSGIQWFVQKGDNSGSGNATLADSVLTAGWNFCTFVADGSNLRTYYGPGIASGTAALAGPYIPADTDNWVFGDARGAGGTMFCSMDDAAYFGRALSAGEIAQRYELSRRGYPGLLNRVRRVRHFVQGGALQTATAQAASVTCSAHAPTASGASTATATATAATVTCSAIDVSAASGTQTATAQVATVTVSAHAPTASATGTVTVTAGIGSVSVTAIAPSATATGTVTVAAGIASVTASAIAPTASPAGSATATVGFASVTCSAVAPTASGSGTGSATAGVATVTVAAIAPGVNLLGATYTAWVAAVQVWAPGLAAGQVWTSDRAVDVWAAGVEAGQIVE